MNDRIANLIVQQARRTGADPLTLLATAIVESGLDPRAVGDNGTSYGLFQMHVGGAGGKTHDEARRYLDPMTAIENRARHFRGGSGGSFAASVQRPYDAAGYARKVDGIIAQLRAGKHPAAVALKGGSLNAPVSTAGQMRAGSGPSSRSAAIGLIFDNDPVFNAAAQERWSAAPTVASAIRSPGRKQGKGVPPQRPGEPGWKYLQRLGNSLFGLKNDPGNSQTFGGRHSSGSEHYDERAIDFGDARNSREQLNAWLAWARRAGFDAIDEGDHIHVSLPGSGI